MLDSANVHTRAWILLGINCGYIQRDVSDLTIAAVDFENALIDFPRPKTAIERRCTLWPETAEALEASSQNRPQPNNSEDASQFFVTREGNRLIRINTSETRSDAVHDGLERVQKKLRIKQAGRSFGAFRHTFRTIADETHDFPAILSIMGHGDHSISDYYRVRIEDERLRRVVNHVRAWLFQQ